MFVIALIQAPHLGDWLLPMLLYIGPDVFLPLTSALAAIGGIILMFWQRIVGLVGKLFGRSKGAPTEPPQPRSGD